ncbi:hypothetical protein [Clostridium butyricum]|uniref:Uncharacterized protein n=1 Tax=Clostridium butyricum E4 str. BoNT E BL5262 TaxID=632245 RepID=C4IKR3_CLOBU|nr:hypothetical protein [Clostridium butyricum]APF23461.1 hypothetical protein NPD4_2653 [Clostridium butyricum]EDT75133.1 hypothetical protein CBY_3286 [Clostridium butyricum 5521]EEP53792.1 hypothetical protein CLP_1296 [Clostridium butyricum E4 str. BoNT E BL5262]NFL32911.1 hypothetical protein [Clostridium butyricum]NFS20273.1 hypothetical protein [Clostridium butyricum]
MDATTIGAIGSFIQSVGFPIFIAIVLLVFTWKYIIPVLQESIKNNKECTQTLCLMNDRVRNIETDISGIKDDVRDIKNKINL